MQLFTFGLNHHTAPVKIREQVAFPAENLETALSDLVRNPAVQEAAILSTCNRTEIYCNADHPDTVTNWLADYHRLPPQKITPYLYALDNDKAVKHTFRVASGLDSMVFGETQILGQMKQAVRQAQHAGTLGAVLHRLFQSTFSTAKEVRSTTEVGANSVSLAAAAVRLAQRIFASISEQNVLFIGAGEMIELCVAHFAAQHPKKMLIANRTLNRAEALAGRIGASAIALDDLAEHLASYDIIITSTGSPLPIVGLGLVERAIKARRHKPIFMVDLAVPRDIEPEVGKLNDVYLYGVDELAKIVEAGKDARQAAAKEAETIIDTRVHDFMDWLEKRHSVPTIRAMREHAERYRQEELLRAQKRLAQGEDPAQVLELLSNSLTNKFLHIPTHALNHLSGEDRAELESWLRRIYQFKHQ